jgi:AmmeMemoRadiSam system protein B
MPVVSARPAAVAGSFYPGNAPELSRCVDAMLLAGDGGARRPKALIAPHAGYVYSGPTAARAYATLRPFASEIQRVVLFGPAHRLAINGLAAPTVDAFVTPLGSVPVDHQALATACQFPQVQWNDDAHAREHSLEVQLPFLQRLLGEFTIAPFVVGNTNATAVAEVMDALWGGDETLLVVSSDLSHYLPYADAQRIDRTSVEAIRGLEPLRHFDQACGALPINGLVATARKRNLQAELLDWRNSGDTAGDKARVVGYAALAFYES